MTFLTSLLLRLLPYLLGLAPEAWAVLKPVLLASGKNFLADAIKAAGPLVKQADAFPHPGEEKRQIVAEQLVESFTRDGKALTKSVANLAVELALQKLRATSAQ